MKKISFFILFFASLLYGQSAQTKTIIELKSNAKQIPLSSNITPFATGEISEKKSAFLAVVYSLLLPGMGELYAGNYDRGKYFTITEGVCWGTYAGFKIYGNQRRNSYKSFAALNGGVDLSGKDADYFADISEYVNIDAYNRRKGLNREYNEIYNSKNDYWKWKDDAQRAEYRNMWESSEQAFNNVRFAVGALIINRIISAIDAALIVRSYNKKLSMQTSWNVSVSTNSIYPAGMEINFLKSF